MEGLKVRRCRNTKKDEGLKIRSSPRHAQRTTYAKRENKHLC